MRTTHLGVAGNSLSRRSFFRSSHRPYPAPGVYACCSFTQKVVHLSPAIDLRGPQRISASSFAFAKAEIRKHSPAGLVWCAGPCLGCVDDAQLLLRELAPVPPATAAVPDRWREEGGVRWRRGVCRGCHYSTRLPKGPSNGVFSKRHSHCRGGGRPEEGRSRVNRSLASLRHT